MTSNHLLGRAGAAPVVDRFDHLGVGAKRGFHHAGRLAASN